MPVIAELHDGTRLEFPDGTDPAVVQRTVQGLIGQQKKPETFGEGVKRQVGEIGRQAGLMARAPMMAVGSTAGLLFDPIVDTVNFASEKLGSDFRLTPGRETMSWAADQMGLPKPETTAEKFTSAFAEGATGAALPIAIANQVKPVGEVTKRLVQALRANPMAQITAGGSAGGASELAREADLGEIPAAVIGLTAGVMGGKAWDKAEALGRSIIPSRVDPQKMQIRVTRVIENAGLPKERIDANVRKEVERILSMSTQQGVPVDDAQLSRWMALRASGVPAKSITRAMVTRDPMDWQTEMRVQKTPEGTPLRDAYLGAESAIDDSLRAVSSNPKADGDVGRLVRGGIDDHVAALKRNTNKAYEAVRKSPQAARGVDMADLRSQLEAGKRAAINPRPFETALAQLDDFSANGQAIRIDKLEQIQQILNDQWTPDNQAAIGKINSILRDATAKTVGDDVYRPAREAHQIERLTTKEQSGVAKLLKDKTRIDAAVPDEKVFQSVVINGSESDLKQVINVLKLGNNPNAIEALRAKTIEHLADALRAGETQKARFATFDRRMQQLQDKLPALFSAEEVQQLNRIRDAGESVLTEVNRSFVNNSNTANDALSWVRALMNLPGVRQVDTLSLGLPGAVVDAGVGAVNSRANQRLVDGLLNYSPVQPRPTESPLLPRLLLGASLGGSAATDSKRQK